MTAGGRYSGLWRGLLEATLFALVYLAAAELGHWLSLPGDNPAKAFPTFWPPSGLYLAVLLRRGYRHWPGFILAALLASFVSNVAIHQKNIPISLEFWLANTLEAVAGAGLIRLALGRAPSLSSVKEVLIVFLLGGAVSTALSATMGAIIIQVAVGGNSFWTTWRGWWAGDAVAVVTLAPLFLTWIESKVRERLAPGRLVETGVLFLAVPVLIFMLIYLEPNFPSVMLLMPALLWATLRYGNRGTALFILMAVLVGMWNLKTGQGLVSNLRFSPTDRMILVQTAASIVGVSAWILAAAIAERRQVEKELRNSQALYYSLVDSLPVFLFRKDTAGHLIFANQRFCQLLGKPLDQISGKTDFDLFPPDLASAYQRDDRRVLESGTILDREEEHELPGGERRQVQVLKVPVVDSRGQAIGLQGIFWDITERKHAEEMLKHAEETQRASEARLLSIIETAPDFIVTLDRQGTILFINRVQPELTKEKMVGSSTFDYQPPEGREKMKAALDNVFQTGQINEFESQGTGPGGTTTWFLSRVGPILHEGCVVAATLCATDITARKVAEEQVLASLREKDALLKEVHHRVKNNLQVINSLLNLQAEQYAGAMDRAVFVESQNRVRAMALVHETLYRSEGLARIDMAGYVESLCSYLFRAYGMDPTRVQLAPSLAGITLDLDRAVPCGLIVNELVSNALKYAFPADRVGRLEVIMAQSSKVGYSLKVSDDGVGLPEGMEQGGSGSLGLHLVHLLARQLGGTVELDRAGGTAFTIAFPA
jgi:PAS domain S-box-containing protein